MLQQGHLWVTETLHVVNILASKKSNEYRKHSVVHTTFTLLSIKLYLYVYTLLRNLSLRPTTCARTKAAFRPPAPWRVAGLCCAMGRYLTREPAVCSTLVHHCDNCTVKDCICALKLVPGYSENVEPITTPISPPV